MNKIVECVPNFSEGKDKEVIDAITAEASKVTGAKLLNVEPDGDYNRTVVTIAGEPDAVVDAAFLVFKKAAELIDMTKHVGEHPRMGATDVVPFVPVQNMTMNECVECAKKFGAKAGELGIPIYLYEYAASKPEWKNLATVRKGQYEALPEKLAQPEWKPDFGPAEFNARSGATAVCARKFLIAYNVNLTDDNVDAANEIALRLRESGRVLTDANGNKLRDENGKLKRQPGKLKNVKGMGFLLEQAGIAQVSMNLTDFETTPPHVAFEESKKEAKELGVTVNGSEVVGVVPKKSMIMAADYYIKAEGLDKNMDERAKVELAVEKLGLNALNAFDIDRKVIEYMI